MNIAVFSFGNKVKVNLIQGSKKLEIETPEINTQYLLDFAIEDEQVIIPLGEDLNLIIEPIGEENSKYGIMFNEVVGLNLKVQSTEKDNVQRMKARIEFEVSK